MREAEIRSRPLRCAGCQRRSGRGYAGPAFEGGRHSNISNVASSRGCPSLYGQNHDEELWGDPYSFRPARFLDRPPGPDALIPQGGGDPAGGHRCPGERITVGLLQVLAVRLARLECTVPEQDLRIPLHRIPTRPRSGFAVTGVRAP